MFVLYYNSLTDPGVRGLRTGTVIGTLFFALRSMNERMPHKLIRLLSQSKNRSIFWIFFNQIETNPERF